MDKIQSLKHELSQPKILFALVVIVILVVIKFVLMPWTEWRQDKVEFLSLAGLNSRSENEILVSTAAYQRGQETLSSQLTLLNSKYFEDKSDSLELRLQQIVDKAATSNMIKTLSRNVNSNLFESGIVEYRMQLRAEGPLDGINRFINSLESRDKLFLIRRVAIQTRSSNSKDSLPFQVTISIFNRTNN